MKRTASALAAAGLMLGAVAVAAPAQAKQEPSPNNNLLSIVRVTTDSVRLKTSCPNDPPDFAIVSFPQAGLVGGAKQITCDGTTQYVDVPTVSTLTKGSRVFVYATISGDSGEINDWGTFKVHR